MATIGYREFLALLAAEFPNVADEIRAEGSDHLHLDTVTFRRATERAMDTGQFWTAEQHFRLVERVLKDAAPDVENALRVSYVEDLALGECTPQRHRAVKECMPPEMRADMASIHDNWRYCLASRCGGPGHMGGFGQCVVFRYVAGPQSMDAVNWLAQSIRRRDRS